MDIAAPIGVSAPSQKLPIGGTKGRVLVIDDTEEDRRLLTRVLTADGYAVVIAVDGDDGIGQVASSAPDLILLDVLMPGIDGFEVCRRIKGNPDTRLIPVVLVTSLQEREDKIRGINAGADDFISKPANPHELRARVRSLVRLKQCTDDLRASEQVLRSLACLIGERVPFARGRADRIAAYATALAIRCELPDADLIALQRAAALHDLGFAATPDAAWLATGPLAGSLRTAIERHAVIDAEICGQTRALRSVQPLLRAHHERLDGSGYPDRLCGDAIPVAAQILGIAEAYDAMVTPRPFRPALTQEGALAELRRDVDRHWRRSDLVDAFAALANGHRLDRLVASESP